MPLHPGKVGKMIALLGAAALAGYIVGMLIVPIVGVILFALGAFMTAGGSGGHRRLGILLLLAGPILIIERFVFRGRIQMGSLEPVLRITGPAIALTIVLIGIWLIRRAGPPPAEVDDRAGDGKTSRRSGLLPALGLFFLAPVTAEYIQAYDTSTGDLPVLLGNLVIFGPLYGAPALLIREVSRRNGLRWPGIMILATAFGVIQATLVDHSLFNDNYRDIEGWTDTMMPTFIPALGIAGSFAVNFIFGHAIWSFGAAIALVESVAGPSRRGPWLGNLGLGIVIALYLAACLLVATESIKTEDFFPSAGQIAGSVVVVVLLFVAALRSKDGHLVPKEGTTPAPWLVGITAYFLIGLATLTEIGLYVAGLEYPLSERWPGVLLYLVSYGALAALLLHWSRLRGWSEVHILGATAGVLLLRLSEAFLSEPIGDVSPARQLGHNIGFLLGFAVLIAVAARNLRKNPANNAEVTAP